MIPPDVDLNRILTDIKQDSVSVGMNIKKAEPTFALDLATAVANLESGEFGTLGVIVLEVTPSPASSIRDIGQEVLMRSDKDTIAVRTPGSGAVVSDIHSRASLESGQEFFLNNNDYIQGTVALVNQVVHPVPPRPSMKMATVEIGLVIVLAIALAAFSFRKWWKKS